MNVRVRRGRPWQRGPLAMFGVLAWLATYAIGCDAPPVDDEEPFDPSTYADGSEPLFEPTRLLEVALTLEPDDWETLGREGRTLQAGSCAEIANGPQDYDYTYFPAELSIDGEDLETVGVRKKGYIGSLTVTTPSLKVDFDRFGGEPEQLGLGRLTLNNNKQDASKVRQCLTYELFRKAGVPAPRCNFARVTVNGDSLGTYSNVESIGRRFLRRHFADASGNLYEGQNGSDLLADTIDWFELKTNESQPDRGDLAALAKALTASDDDLLEALSPHLDVDRFLTYWAMEALTASWDSYSTLANNFWLYRDPDSGFVFIPWGTDATLNESGLVGGTRQQHVSTDSILSKRLYALPEVRDRYYERLRMLLDEVWDVDAILGRIDELSDLLDDADPAGLDQIRSFVRKRRKLIEAELEEGKADFVSGQICFNRGLPVSGTFQGYWGGGDGESSLSIEVDGTPVPLMAPRVSASMGASPVVPGAPGITLSARTQDDKPLSIIFSVEGPLFSSGVIPFHGSSIIGLLTTPTALGLEDVSLAMISEGSIELTEAGMEDGDVIAGSFSGRIYAAEL